MEKKLVLELNELPQRAERLNPEQIQKVFGGCSKSEGICFKGSDCCEPEDGSSMRVCTSQLKCLYV